MFLSANFNFGTVNILGFEIKFSEFMADNQNCGREAACWPYIYEKFYMYIYGFYPREESWRPDVVYGLTALLFVTVRLVRNYKHKNRVILSMIVTFPIVSYILMAGGFGLLPVVETHQWGGLTLSLIIASVGYYRFFPDRSCVSAWKAVDLKVIKLFSNNFY